MKQKILAVLLGSAFLLLLGVTVSGYQTYQQQLRDLYVEQQSAQKQIADLNDRLVAVARQQQDKPALQQGNGADVLLLPNQSQQLQLNRQRSQLRQMQHQWTLNGLQLAQDYLKQANYQKAQYLLLQLEHNLLSSQQYLADPLDSTLLQTLKIDQLSISQANTRQQIQQQNLLQDLAQLQQQLNAMAVQAPGSWQNQLGQNPPGMLSAAWFKQLFILAPATPQLTQHMLDRQFICKQASLAVGVARLAAQQNNQAHFASQMNEAISQLNLLTDPDARKTAQQLQQLKNQNLPLSIELSSLALLAGQQGKS